MRHGRHHWRFGWVGAGVVTALAVGALAAAPSLFGLMPREAELPRMTTTPVRKIDLNVPLLTSGEVDSTEKTKIECEIENVNFRAAGSSISVNGSSTVLTIVPDGTTVKKGDVLCVLDSSAYEELVRVQQINLDRARADFEQARLGLEVAEMNVVEYRDGLMSQTIKQLKGQIALAESDLERASDRLEWSRRMLAKGYLALGQLKSEEFSLAKMEHGLTQARTALEIFEKYTAPKQLQVLGSNVTAAETTRMYQERRLARFEERFSFYKKQVENCTIRAPHDGFLIYANDRRRQVQIEPGMMVHHRQDLFYLPDFGKMQVNAKLHESIVKEVKAGQRVKVRMEALPGRLVEGHVESIAQLPMSDWFNDVRNFLAVVKLDNVPKGMRPGMTAEVEITTVHKPDTLVVPAEALTIEDGQDICYVVNNGIVERRAVVVGEGTIDLLEVTEGLNEGDEVVLDPTQVDGLLALAVTVPASPQAIAAVTN